MPESVLLDAAICILLGLIGSNSQMTRMKENPPITTSSEEHVSEQQQKLWQKHLVNSPSNED